MYICIMSIKSNIPSMAVCYFYYFKFVYFNNIFIFYLYLKTIKQHNNYKYTEFQTLYISISKL